MKTFTKNGRKKSLKIAVKNEFCSNSRVYFIFRRSPIKLRVIQQKIWFIYFFVDLDWSIKQVNLGPFFDHAEDAPDLHIHSSLSVCFQTRAFNSSRRSFSLQSNPLFCHKKKLPLSFLNQETIFELQKKEQALAHVSVSSFSTNFSCRSQEAWRWMWILQHYLLIPHTITHQRLHKTSASVNLKTHQVVTIWFEKDQSPLANGVWLMFKSGSVRIVVTFIICIPSNSWNKTLQVMKN